MKKECFLSVERLPTLLSWCALIAFISVEILRAKWKVCLPAADCESYLRMVWHWGYVESILPHHAMRIVPSMLVFGLTALGLTVDQGFWLVSVTAFVTFAFGVHKYFQMQSTKTLLPVGFTFLLLSAHWAMTYGLSNIYQATDALTYPLGLLLFCQLMRKNTTGLLITGLIGCAVRQSLFVLAFIAIVQLLIEKKQRHDWIKLVLLVVGYTALTRYYHASGTLLVHLIPDSAFFTTNHIWKVWIDSQLTWLLVPLVPMFVARPERFIMFFSQYPALLFYSAIVVAQPFIAFEMTGQANFVRIAMQGIWPLYLAAGWAVLTSCLSRAEHWLWFIYAILIASSYSQNLRVMAVCLAVLVILTSKIRSKYVPTNP